MIGLIKRQIYGSLHDSGRWVLGIPFWELTKRTLLETILLYCLQHCSIRLIPSLWAFVPITAQLYLGQGWTNFFYKGQFKKNKIHNIVCIYTCNTTATELKKKNQETQELRLRAFQRFILQLHSQDQTPLACIAESGISIETLNWFDGWVKHFWSWFILPFPHWFHTLLGSFPCASEFCY